MTLLSSIIKTFEQSSIAQYGEKLLPSHRKALEAMRGCRSIQSPKMPIIFWSHSRRLDFHPHVYLVIPAGAIDRNKRLWRTKKNKKPFLFSHTALAKVFLEEVK